MLATGNIKKYQIVMGIIYVGSFILCYLFFAIGLGPEFGYISTIITYSIAVFARLKLLSQMIPEFSAKFFFVQVFVKSFVVVVFSTSFVFLFKQFVHIPNLFLDCILVVFISLVSVAIISYLLALSKKEREVLKVQALRLVKKK
jgi:hypothetical protein